MPYGLIDYNTLKDIGRALRLKTNSNREYYPRDMAQAINTIVSGGGYKSPVISSILYGQNSWDNSILTRWSLFGIERVNVLPDNVTIIDVTNSGGMSPANVTVYKRFVPDYEHNTGIKNDSNNNYIIEHYSGNMLGLYVEPRWNADEISIIDMSEIFSGDYYIWAGIYTNETICMRNTFSGSNVRIAMCGPKVTDMSTAYNGCGNLVDAVCGENVKYMMGSYNACVNLVNSAVGNNVVDMTNAYAYCGSSLKKASFGPKVKNAAGAYYQCYSVTKVDKLPATLVNANCLFEYCNNITNVTFESCENLSSAYCMFNNCTNLQYVNSEDNSTFNNLSYLNNMFGNCMNLLSVPNITNLKKNANNLAQMFYNCSNLSNVYISFSPDYSIASNQWTSTNIEIDQIFYNCINIGQESIDCLMTNAIFAAYNRDKDILPYKDHWFNNTVTYTKGDKVIYYGRVYEYYNDTPSVGDWNATNNWLYIQGTTGIECSHAFYNCKKITTAYYSEHMENDAYCVYGSTGEINNIVFNGYISNMTRTFEDSNILICECPDTVILFNDAYANCRKLTGSAVCGNNVVNMAGTYRFCTNITAAASGENVRHMYNTYYGCSNLLTAACGNNVNNFYNTYRNCYNLTDAACGSNVTNMAYTYANCHNLINAACGENVTIMYNTYTDCHSLENAVCGENVTMMIGTYINCWNLKNANIGNKVTNLYEAFKNCNNLTGDIELGNILWMVNAFYNTNLVNVYINTKSSTSYSATAYANAFYKSANDVRRNFVFSNRNSFNCITYYSARVFDPSRQVIYTNENYETPVEVNVNGNSYNCVRCAYNTTYNCYIYCME